MNFPKRPIFVRGAKYKCKREIQRGPSKVLANEILTFVDESYSIYDTSNVYEFRSNRDGVIKSWLSREDEPISLRDNFFELV